ncbi:F-box/FBD/LRR-repeat protein At4g00160 [Linum perenne]
MKKKRGKSTAIPVAAGEAEDRISELPDEILHKILCDIISSKQVAKTSVLSRRWQSLWGTYPDVKFDKAEYGGRHGSIIAAAFQNFVDASIEKFALNSQLSMRTLDITIDCVQSEPYRSLPLERLLKLASARNAECVSIEARGDEYSDFPLSFTSLRTLELQHIKFDHEQSFTSFLASCPFLETLTIGIIRAVKKLLVSNVPNLKYLRILTCLSPEEIEIEAPSLQTLCLNSSRSVTKLHLIAPQLICLDIEDYSNLKGGVLGTVISKLQSLNFLFLSGLERLGKKLKLSIPTVEVFELYAECDLEEIELNAGPSMLRFILFIDCQQTFPEELQKCVINNTTACQWIVHITLPIVYGEMDEGDEVHRSGILESTKSFIAKYPQFQTVRFKVLDDHKVTLFEEESGDPPKNPTTINHLKLHTSLSTKGDHEGVLEAMFWICRPKFLTLVPEPSISKEFFQILLNIKSSLNTSGEHRIKWQDQLKDVKIVKGDVDRVVEGRGEEMERMDVLFNTIRRGTYPDVEFNKAEYGGIYGGSIAAAFLNFVDASIDKFALNSQLSMRTLDIRIDGEQRNLIEPSRPPPLQRLLKLASARNAESVTIVSVRNIFLPYRLLPHSCVKTLRLKGIVFNLDKYSDSPLSFISLRRLELQPIVFDIEQSFTSLVASCPFLETLIIGGICQVRKLLVSNVPNLKYFRIDSCLSPEEIEIEAPSLQTLRMRSSNRVNKLHLIAPQLTYLGIADYSSLTGGALRPVISKLQSLKILSLYRLEELGKKLKLSIPTLEVFELYVPCDLEEIELDAGPSLSRFILCTECEPTFPEELQKFVINNTIACQWTVDITLPRAYVEGDEVDEWEESIRWSILDSAKSFIAKFPQFQTVNFRVLDDNKVTLFEEESDDPPKNPTTINHLKLHTSLTMKGDHEGVLEAMFWICRPKFLTLVPEHSISKEFFQILSNIKLSLNTSDEHRIKWQDQLKDVKIVKGDVDRVVEGRGEEMELMDVSKDMATLLATEKQVCFLLTWC